ncbi:MAG: PilZ domain-containing protein [Rhodospirillales bacterium]|nr:PilZ domain-containing protein [Rhodospirillales bacterium]
MVKNKRQFRRDQPTVKIEVNDGTPCQGGVLVDISAGGAAVEYPHDVGVTDNSLEVGQPLILNMSNQSKFPAKVVRVYEKGFATEFDFSMGRTRIR